MKLYCITVTVCARDVCREHTHALTLGLCFSELVPHRAINLTHSFATAHPPLMGTPIRTNSFENNHLHSLHTNSHPNSFELCKQKKKCARLLFSFLNVRVRIDCFRVCMYSFSFFSPWHVGSLFLCIGGFCVCLPCPLEIGRLLIGMLQSCRRSRFRFPSLFII